MCFILIVVCDVLLYLVKPVSHSLLNFDLYMYVIHICDPHELHILVFLHFMCFTRKLVSNIDFEA